MERTDRVVSISHSTPRASGPHGRLRALRAPLSGKAPARGLRFERRCSRANTDKGGKGATAVCGRDLSLLTSDTAALGAECSGRRLARAVAAVLTAVVIILLACASFCPAAAVAAPCGSIAIEAACWQGGTAVPVSGDTWRLAQVASAQFSDDGDELSYATTEAFAAFDYDWASLDASGLREAARDLGAYARDHDLLTDGASVTNESGRAIFCGLAPGLYVAVRTDVASANRAYVCDPVLVSVPMREDGAWLFDVAANPKFENPGDQPENPSDEPSDNPSDNPSDKPSDNPSEHPEGNPSETPPAESQEPAGVVDRLLSYLKLPQLGDARVAGSLLAAAVALLCVATGWRLRRRASRAAASASKGDGSATLSGARGAEGHTRDEDDGAGSGRKDA